MRSQPLSSAASRRRAEEQFKTKKKVDSADTPAQQAEAEKIAPARASAGQGSSRQGDGNSRRGGSDGRSICAAPTRFGGTSGLTSVRTQVAPNA